MIPRPPFILAAALRDPDPRPDPARWTHAARLAEDAGLDFVTLEPGPQDPLLVAARLAAQTTCLGLVPVAPTTTTEPFHVSTELATIDLVSHGRAGWVAEVLPRDRAAGEVTWEVPEDVAGDAAEHLDVVRRLWDSWEEGAEIRDAATARFIDRDRVHHVGFRGRHLAVRGPSITPRPPQGHPVIGVRVRDAATLALAARHADLVVGADPDAAPPPGVLHLLEVSVAAGEEAALAERLLEHRARGDADGFLLHAGDLAAALAALVPALEAHGVDRPPPAGTLRERLGLAPAPNRYAA